MNSKPTYLVTGGAGFIGSNFVKHLVGEYGGDINILILDALTYAGNLGTISEEIKRPEMTFVHGDINDAGPVGQLLTEHDPDYTVNFAAESHADRSKTARKLGWVPVTTFDDGIRKTVRWYLENTDWVDNATSGGYRDYYAGMYNNR